MKTPVTFRETVLMGIVQFEVLNQSVQETIAAADYGDVDNVIIKSRTLSRNPGTRRAAIWHPDRQITSDAAFEAMCSMSCIIDGKAFKGRPGTIEELASCERHSLKGS